MSYRWIEHTAELELEIEGASPEAVFADALRAFGELLGEDDRGEAVSVRVSIAARDRATLLAEWLDELVFMAETDGLVPVGVERLELGDADLSATIRAVRGNPRTLVKGVTYHRLTFEACDTGFRGTVVLDV